MANSQHEVKSGHGIDSKPLIDQITVLDPESRDSHRKVLEAIHIKLRGATLNLKDGYQLPDLYMPLLCEEAKEGEGLPLTPAPPQMRS